MFVVSIYSHGQTKITMEKEGGIYLVPCKVNGLPLKFIFDTGASDVSISLTEAVFMLKNSYLHKEDIGEEVWYGIANGDIAKGTIINIKEIEFAGLKLYNVKASIVHETKAPLLLGQSAIEKLGKIQLDGRELTILNQGKNSYNYNKTDLPIKISKTTYLKVSENSFLYSFSGDEQYDFVGSLNDDLAYVRKNGLYGYVNSKGQIVIPINYLQAYCFHNGVALVSDENGSFYIDKNGNKTNKDYAGKSF